MADYQNSIAAQTPINKAAYDITVFSNRADEEKDWPAQCTITAWIGGVSVTLPMRPEDAITLASSLALAAIAAEAPGAEIIPLRSGGDCLMIWQPHTRKPVQPGQTAIIAVRCEPTEPGDCDRYLLSELYRYDTHWGCWMTEGSGLKLKHTEYWWMPEGEILEGLPA